MSVTSFQTIIRHLIRHPDDLTSNDDLGWKLLDKDFVLKGIKDSSYDVDFLSITGPCEKFIDDVRIESLISAGRSKIFKKCSLKYLKGSYAKSVFIFAECGDYLLGKLIDDDMNVCPDDFSSVDEIADEIIDSNGALAEKYIEI